MKAVTLKNPNREVYEGNTVQNYYNDTYYLVEMVMNGQSWHKPFTSKQELKEWLSTNQSYVKKPIPELVTYYSQLYGIK